MAGIDVLGCAGAIVSAFHGAAGMAQTIKTRNDRRRRMNGVTQDGEEAFEEKLFLKSLNDGEAQCKSSRDEKYKRYGSSFKTGDPDALSALKDVMVSLQMDVVSALQVAQAVANAQLDLSRLHESVIMNKNNALRAMEDLCKRLPEPEAGSEMDDVRSIRSNESAGQVRMTGVDRPLAVTLPSMASTTSLPHTPRPAPAKPAKHIRSQSDKVERSEKPEKPEKPNQAKKRGFARMFSGLGASLTMANDDYGSFKRETETLRSKTLQEAQQQKRSAEQDSERSQSLASDAPTKISLPMRDSGFGGSDSQSLHRQSPSITSTMYPGERNSYPTAESNLHEAPSVRNSVHRPSPSIASTVFSEDRNSYTPADSEQQTPIGGRPRRDSETLPAAPLPTTSPPMRPAVSHSPDLGKLSPDLGNSRRHGLHHTHSSSTSSSFHRVNVPVTQWEDDDGVMRATLAPEVVTSEYESRLPPRSGTVSPYSRPGTSTPQEHNYFPQYVHPAHREAWPTDRPVSPPLSESNWSSIIPAQPQTFQNFCRGAWQIRERPDEGLAIAMLPSAHDRTINVPYWKCTQCHFRSRAMSSPTQSPDQIYVLPNGIKYRWLFLAKSHMPAENLQSRLAAYTYGCVFCTAEGRETAEHGSIDALLSHIASKHKTSMMTPEVKNAAKCIVGGFQGDVVEWDIDLPERIGGRFGGVFGRR